MNPNYPNNFNIDPANLPPIHAAEPMEISDLSALFPRLDCSADEAAAQPMIPERVQVGAPGGDELAEIEMFLFGDTMKNRKRKINYSGHVRPTPISPGERKELTQAHQLISFFNHLQTRMPQLGAPQLEGNDPIQQAHIIRLWMAESMEIQTLQELNLAGLELTCLPPEIALFSQLKTFDLSNNKLKILPSEILKLQQLENFNCSHNLLRELPDTFGALFSLEECDLSYNCLKTIPGTFSHLNIHTLNLSNNQLTDLPSTFRNLEKLMTCNLSHNCLQKLPRHFSDLDALLFLDLSHNRLKALPYTFGKLEVLQECDLSNNCLRILPLTFPDLEALRFLNLSHNQLTTLPDQFGNLQVLQACDLSHNQLEALPDQFGNLQVLQACDLSHNCLNTLPPTFPNLNALRLLDLANNHLADLSDIGQLESLLELNIAHNRLEQFPNLENLSNLVHLNASSNDFTEIPPTIRQLTKLTTLDLSRNFIMELPDLAFWDEGLIALTTLNLSHNWLTEIPKSIRKLNHLKTLDLSNNAIKKLPALAKRDEHANIIGLLELETLHLNDNNLHSMDPRNTLLDTLTITGNFPMQHLRSWLREFVETFQPDAPDALAIWHDRMEQFDQLSASLTEEKKLQLSIYLGRLREIEDYDQKGESRNNIILRVERMVQLACDNPTFKEKLLTTIEDAMSNCGDRVLVTFNDIEVEAQFYQPDLSQEEFKALAIRASRYYLTKQYAQEFAYKNRAGDTVEVILGLHIYLRDDLDLPITTKGMLYPGSSLFVHPETGVINVALLAQAKSDILAFSDQSLLEKSPHWQAYMTARFPEEARQITEKRDQWMERVSEYYMADEEEQATLRAQYELEGGEFYDLLKGTEGYLATAARIEQKQAEEITQLDTAMQRKQWLLHAETYYQCTPEERDNFVATHDLHNPLAYGELFEILQSNKNYEDAKEQISAVQFN